jgi:hypothetical protein
VIWRRACSRSSSEVKLKIAMVRIIQQEILSLLCVYFPVRTKNEKSKLVSSSPKHARNQHVGTTEA